MQKWLFWKWLETFWIIAAKLLWLRTPELQQQEQRSHVTKTRNAFQITACAFYKHLKSAFDNKQLYSGEMDLCFEDWCYVNCKEQPTFKYWFIILSVILAYLDFVFSIRRGLFKTYTSSLAAIFPLPVC